MSTPFWILAELGTNAPVNGNLSQVSRWVTEFRDYLYVQGPGFLMNLVAALLIFLAGRLLANWLTQLLGVAMRRSRVDETLVQFARSIVYWTLLAFVLIAVLERLGVNTTSFAALIAATGLAIGLALQNSLGNFASGVLLILFQPFRVGNFVEIGGTGGIIEEIQIFNTVLRTPDNVRIIMPNSTITGSTVKNYATNQVRRIDLIVTCGYEDDLRAVREFLEELLAAEERILDEPLPLVAVDQLADSGVNFVVRPWVRTAEYWDVRWSLTEAIKNGFDDRGFHIPYPTRDLHVYAHTPTER
ncbi:MAG: mechanosensitive ion channel [Planctomycetaceae bacterium]|nr:mechanosensitive ion channel [Planctomycetaceae bacterium]